MYTVSPSGDYKGLTNLRIDAEREFRTAGRPGSSRAFRSSLRRRPAREVVRGSRRGGALPAGWDRGHRGGVCMQAGRLPDEQGRRLAGRLGLLRPTARARTGYPGPCPPHPFSRAVLALFVSLATLPICAGERMHAHILTEQTAKLIMTHARKSLGSPRATRAMEAVTRAIRWRIAEAVGKAASVRHKEGRTRRGRRSEAPGRGCR